jgi:hypothetical protein
MHLEPKTKQINHKMTDILLKSNLPLIISSPNLL